MESPLISVLIGSIDPRFVASSHRSFLSTGTAIPVEDVGPESFATASSRRTIASACSMVARSERERLTPPPLACRPCWSLRRLGLGSCAAGYSEWRWICTDERSLNGSGDPLEHVPNLLATPACRLAQRIHQLSCLPLGHRKHAPLSQPGGSNPGSDGCGSPRRISCSTGISRSVR
jgi:hypothetical protein